MASFTARHNRNRVGLPAHFDPGQYTSVAIVNQDHEEAKTSEHDTVTVLFQDMPHTVNQNSRPRISDTEVIHGPQAFKEVLPSHTFTSLLTVRTFQRLMK